MNAEALITYWKKELKNCTADNILLSRNELEQLVSELSKLQHIYTYERRKNSDPSIISGTWVGET